MKTALICLALNIFFESADQPFLGQLAVGQTVMNRVLSGKFPSTVCEVVKQGPTYKGNPIRNRCQFSWYCDGKSDTPEDSTAWFVARSIAHDILNMNYDDYLDGALWYHSIHVNPVWSSTKERIVRIEDHIFYK
jgi:N-acetylmuramoyl-L-alanine amidase